MQKIVKIYYAFDQFLLSKVQDGYLWLLDRTGVYVATLIFGSFLVAAAIGIFQHKTDHGWMVFIGVCIAIIGLTCLLPYGLQDKGKNEKFNALALYIEAGYSRHFFVGLQYGFLVMDLIDLDVISIIATIFLIACFILQTVKIRDRDKKPFFKPVERLATDGVEGRI